MGVLSVCEDVVVQNMTLQMTGELSERVRTLLGEDTLQKEVYGVLQTVARGSDEKVGC